MFYYVNNCIFFTYHIIIYFYVHGRAYYPLSSTNHPLLIPILIPCTPAQTNREFQRQLREFFSQDLRRVVEGNLFEPSNCISYCNYIKLYTALKSLVGVAYTTNRTPFIYYPKPKFKFLYSLSLSLDFKLYL